MPARVRIDGLTELRAALRSLPSELRDKAEPIVTEAADRSFDAIVAAYPPGSSLARGMRKETASSAFGAAARLRQGAKLGFIYEFGTEIRHTDEGWSRGRMPAGKVFVPTVVRERRAMVLELVTFVESYGLKVSRG